MLDSIPPFISWDPVAKAVTLGPNLNSRTISAGSVDAYPSGPLSVGGNASAITIGSSNTAVAIHTAVFQNNTLSYILNPSAGYSNPIVASAPVAVGAALPFGRLANEYPRSGIILPNGFGSGPLLPFVLLYPGLYEVSWQIPFVEAQAQVGLNVVFGNADGPYLPGTTIIANSLSGRTSSGAQVSNSCFVRTSTPGTVLTLVNALSGGSGASPVTPLSMGGNPGPGVVSAGASVYFTKIA